MFRHIAIATLALSAAIPVALPARAREIVGMRDGRFDPGTIVIRTGERKLYYVVSPGEAIRYTIAVGKAGKQWRGVKYVEELQIDPAWAPPAEVKRDNPRLPDVIPGGSPRNPMGARVIGLGPGGEYAIHGTNMPNTIGTAASYGCFRMHNQDVIDLYARVQMGTPVVVLP
ncbi:L,D-transpeptidase [uncultured Bosea sp.]|uniref:L,D-transpeptidase n=1 Tax=uncultured Bosea sp. TaxID=211457 RepID=UPI0025FDA62A|nr:L,D-transpeptidase [uncultured Bosea sp.]